MSGEPAGQPFWAETGMLFNSLEFVAFFLLVLAGYFLAIPRRLWRARKIFLVSASYLFYMSWNPAFGLLLLLSTAVDFTVGQRLEESSRPSVRRLLLLVSLGVNLGILGFFKYGTFLAETVWFLARPVGGDAVPPALHIVLPVGISFYTFQTLSYSIDIYRRRRDATRNLVDFMLYVSFFPQLVAGPIVRSWEFLPQLEQPPRVTRRKVDDGLARIAMGLVKKVVFADVLGEYVDNVFALPEAYDGWNLLLAVYAYAYQIYFDFSGYTDIAIGLAQLFGIRLPENFRRPYLAATPREFWQRWHISLSGWLRDYLYVGLGGNRRGPSRTHANIMITMVLGGLWHGAAWNFVAWGGYHGLVLVLQRMFFGAHARPHGVVGVWMGRFVTFHIVCAGWVLFRAQSLGDAGTVFRGLGSWAFLPSRAAGQAMLVLGVATALQAVLSAPRARAVYARSPAWLQGVGYGAVAVLVFLFSPATTRFIYFQF
jgi:alginate O-acetyltransferase complex protein AlgI